MSQAGENNTAAGPVPPAVATSYVTQNGTAVPAANVLIVHGVSSSINNANGIIANGGVVGTGTSNEVDLALTNRIHGSTTTSDGAGQSQSFATFSLGAVAGTYLFDVNIAGFDVTDSLSAVYNVFIGRRTDGATASGVGSDTFIEKEEGAMSGTTVSVNTSSNTFKINVTGLAGKTIDWVAVATYVFAS